MLGTLYTGGCNAPRGTNHYCHYTQIALPPTDTTMLRYNPLNYSRNSRTISAQNTAPQPQHATSPHHTAPAFPQLLLFQFFRVDYI